MNTPPIRLRLCEQMDCEELSIDAELAGSAIDFNIDSADSKVKCNTLNVSE
jgi:hypothetical protein